MILLVTGLLQNVTAFALAEGIGPTMCSTQCCGCMIIMGHCGKSPAGGCPLEASDLFKKRILPATAWHRANLLLLLCNKALHASTKVIVVASCMMQVCY